MDVRELLEYNKQVRHRYLAALVELPWGELVKNREASWHSLRNIFIHTMGAIDHWLAFLQGQEHGKQRAFDDYSSITAIKNYVEQVEQCMEEYLATLNSDSLEKRFNVTNDLGQNVEVTAEDVLIHVFEEEVHHRGEMIALLWQMETEPPLMGWKYL